MLKLKLQYFGHLMRRVDSLEKTLMLGGIWGRRRRGMVEDEMAGWHHWLNGRESVWTPQVGDGQGGLECCSSCRCKELDKTEPLNWTEITGREHGPTHQQKIGLKVYWAWPRPSEQDPVPPSVSLSHQETYISLLSFPSEGRQTENHNHRKLTTLVIWNKALSNSVKLWATWCRATQNRWVMVKSSDNMWFTGEGNGKPLQYSCLENPMNSMKKQNDRTLKEELPRCVGAQYATGDQWRNNTRKKWQNQRKNNTHLWMWLVMEVKSDPVKSNIA